MQVWPRTRGAPAGHDGGEACDGAGDGALAGLAGEAQSGGDLLGGPTFDLRKQDQLAVASGEAREGEFEGAKVLGPARRGARSGAATGRRGESAFGGGLAGGVPLAARQTPGAVPDGRLDDPCRPGQECLIGPRRPGPVPDGVHEGALEDVLGVEPRAESPAETLADEQREALPVADVEGGKGPGVPGPRGAVEEIAIGFRSRWVHGRASGPGVSPATPRAGGLVG